MGSRFKNSNKGETSNGYERKIIKSKCPVCGRRSEFIQDVFYWDVFFCSKCNEEVHESELV